ncbi:MAG TPA: hypothetical protein VIV40_11775 [Kofleriaceae bacterium]
MQKLQMCAAALAVFACASDSDELSGEARRVKDAGVTSTTADAATSTSTDPVGSVSCYTEGAPATTCTLPIHCCFGNYSAQHDGYCTTSSCAWGTIDCDGPEDCASGQHCCATALEYGGWKLACQTSACGAPPSGEELCHDSSTCGGRSCVNTYSVNWDLPRTLYVCR